jgi:hypothetical protein
MEWDRWRTNYRIFYKTFYAELHRIWESKQPKKITIYDILTKQKALTLLARVNNSSYVVNAKNLSAHNRSIYGRLNRSAKINHTVDFLYKDVQIKNVFPTMTRPYLKQLLVDFTNQNDRRRDKKEERLELLKLRKFKRLLPLSEERYGELIGRSKKWADVVYAVHRISTSGYADRHQMTNLSEVTKNTLYRLDEKPNNKFTERERKYA